MSSIGIPTGEALGSCYRLSISRPISSADSASSIRTTSRPFASKLFDEGAIPCRRVGTHRRALRGDVVAYREREKEERKRVLDELAAESQRLNLGY